MRHPCVNFVWTVSSVQNMDCIACVRNMDAGLIQNIKTVQNLLIEKHLVTAVDRGSLTAENLSTPSSVRP
jgi:hypothetical protein